MMAKETNGRPAPSCCEVGEKLVEALKSDLVGP